MANPPRVAYAPLTQSPGDRTGAVGWDGVLPVNGLTHLMRMAVIVLTMSSINLLLQISLATIVSSSGYGYWNKTPSSAIWAAAIALCATLYMGIVTKGAKCKWMKHGKVHMIFALVGCGVACGFLFSGMVMSCITASNIDSVNNSFNRVCVHYDSAGNPDRNLPTASYSGLCYYCNPGYSYRTPVPESCCCCSSFDSMQFYGVKSCDAVFDYGYPIAVISSVLHGVSLATTILLCITTCVVGCCRCYSCSEVCGPFSEDGGVCCRNQPSVAYHSARIITAHPVRNYPLATAAPVSADCADTHVNPGEQGHGHLSGQNAYHVAPVSTVATVQPDGVPGEPSPPPYTGTTFPQ